MKSLRLFLYGIALGALTYELDAAQMSLEPTFDFRKNIQNNTLPFDFYLHHRKSCYFTKQPTLTAIGHIRRHRDFTTTT